MVDSVTQTISSSAERARQLARDNLYGILGKGLEVHKHGNADHSVHFFARCCSSHALLCSLRAGRQNQPKKKRLQCDEDVTRLFWAAASDSTKAVYLAEVLEMRTALEVDTDASSPAAVAAHSAAAKNGVQPAAAPAPLIKRKSSMRMKSAAIDEDALLFGTATIRRHLKPDQAARSLSLIMPDRSALR